MNQLEKKARAFATEAHASIGQTRKYTGDPYIVHPAGVVALVRSVPHTEEMLCAAWLHDTVEDTPVELVDIKREFGNEIATLVYMLTDISKPTDGNRAIRKAIDREHTAMASPQAKTIKLGDLIDNTKTIVRHDPAFSRIYLAEKALLLEVLKEGDSSLWEMARKQI